MKLKQTVRKNIRHLYKGTSEFKKPRTNTAKGEKGDLVADPNNIFPKWRNYFSQLLNVHRVKGVRQNEIHTADPQVLDPSAFEVERDIAKLKRHKSSGVYQL